MVTELENGRHKVFTLQVSKLDTKIINEKLEEIFNMLDSAAKINCSKINEAKLIALVFVLRNIGTGEYRHFYAHEKDTFF